MGFSVVEVAHHFQCSSQTVNNYCYEHHGMKYGLYRDHAMVGVKLNLQIKAIQMAMDGNTTMLLSALKKFCAWDKEPEQVDAMANELESLTDEQLIERARQLTAEHQQLPEPDNIKTVSASGSELYKEELD